MIVIFVLVLLLSVISAEAAVPVVFHGSKIATKTHGFRVGAGIEDVNHELYGGIYVQDVFGEGFEEPATAGISGAGSAGGSRITWQPDPKNSGCRFAISNDAYTGTQSQSISGSSCTIINKGLDTQGMYFTTQQQTYEGYLHLKLVSFNPANVTVSLVDKGKISSFSIDLTPQNWVRQNFRLIAPATSTCAQTSTPVTPCHPNPENACIECSGGFSITVTTVGADAVLIDQVFLAEAYPNPTFARPQIAETFPKMGYTALRLGGSMINTNGYRWKRFRGPPETRQPYSDGLWYKYGSSGYGIFEILRLTELQNMLAIITLNDYESPSDMADLVEYAYGSVNTTWGRVRSLDGHTQPYKPFWVEIGNEQPLTALFTTHVQQISAAMSAKAKSLGLGFGLSFVVGADWVFTHLTDDVVVPILKNSLAVDADFYWDFHIPGDLTFAGDSGQPAGQALTDALTSKKNLFASINPRFKAVVLEENGGTHGINRAIGRFRNSNRLQRLGDFVVIDTPANCLQALGRNDNDWDQGQVFYLPNLVWFAPHGWSSVILSNTLLPNVLVQDDDNAWNKTIDVIAVVDDAFTTVVIRVANFANTNFDASLIVQEVKLTSQNVAVVQMKGPVDGVNTPANPNQYAPVSSFVATPSPIGSVPTLNITLPAYSITTFTIKISK